MSDSRPREEDKGRAAGQGTTAGEASVRGSGVGSAPLPPGGATSVSDPGAVLVMDIAKGKTLLFEPEQSPRGKQVYGANVLSLPEEQRKKLGFETVLPLAVLDRALAGALGRETDLWLRLTFPDKADGARPETGGDYGEEYSIPTAIPRPAIAPPSAS